MVLYVSAAELEKQKSTQQRSDKELEDLRKQTSVLSRRVKGMDAARLSPEGSKSYAGGSLRVSTSEEGYQQVSMTPNEGNTSSLLSDLKYIFSEYQKLFRKCTWYINFNQILVVILHAVKVKPECTVVTLWAYDS